MARVRDLISTAGLTAVLVVSIATATAADQSRHTKFEPARNAQGHPNMQGNWDYRTLTPLERPKMLADQAVFTSAEEEEAFRKKAIELSDVDVNRDATSDLDVEGAYNAWWMDFGTELNEDRRTSLIVSPANGRLPELTPAALAQLKNSGLREHPVRTIVSLKMDNKIWRPKGPENLGLSERCLQSFSGGPPITSSAYNNNLRIIQTPNHVVIFTEMIHNARIIPIDGRSQLPSELERWTGDSRGHWDGDTLVVETTNFTDKTPTYQLPFDLNDYQRNGVVGIGKDMHLIEKFTLASNSRLIYEYTVDDPNTFASPFTVVLPMKATEDQLYEYACHEGNYAMEGMLKGARNMEREQAGASIN